MQHVVRDQIAIAEALSVRRDHGRIFGVEIFGRQIEPPRGFRHQQRAHLGCRMLDRSAAVLHRMAAGGVAFIGGAPCVGGDHLDGFKGNVELFGRDLLERRLEALAKFDLAGEGRDAAVGIDPDPGIEIGRRREAARRLLCRRGGWSLILREGIG